MLDERFEKPSFLVKPELAEQALLGKLQTPAGGGVATSSKLGVNFILWQLIGETRYLPDALLNLAAVRQLSMKIQLFVDGFTVDEGRVSKPPRPGTRVRVRSHLPRDPVIPLPENH